MRLKRSTQIFYQDVGSPIPDDIIYEKVNTRVDGTFNIRTESGRSLHKEINNDQEQNLAPKIMSPRPVDYEDEAEIIIVEEEAQEDKQPEEKTEELMDEAIDDIVDPISAIFEEDLMAVQQKEVKESSDNMSFILAIISVVCLALVAFLIFSFKNFDYMEEPLQNKN